MHRLARVRPVHGRPLHALSVAVATVAALLGTVPAEGADHADGTTAAARPADAVERTLRDPSLTRPTGLAVDPRIPGRVYTVSGSRRTLQVLAVSADGRTRAHWSLRGAQPRHVTDIALGRGRRLWVGDLGDPHRTRRQIGLLSAVLPQRGSSRSLPWTRFRLRYADGRHDAQALLVNPATGRVFVVTRSSRSGGVYAAPRVLSRTRVNVLRRVAAAPSGVTGGEFSRSGRTLALTHDGAVSTGSSFGRLSRVALPAGTAARYVAFTRASDAVLVGARRARAALLRVSLPASTAGAAGASSFRQLGWRAVQAPRPRSITLMNPRLAPATPPSATGGTVMRVELRDGETVTTSGYTAHRAEVYGRNPAGTWSGTPASKWPDPPGSTRWYDFSVYVPADFVLATDQRWLDFTQWKGYRGGSPPIALELHRSEFRLGGSNIARSLGTVKRGGWTRFTVGLHFATTGKRGWVTVYRDGDLKLPRTSVATLDTVNGRPDPIYLKQGIYRSAAWHTTQVLCFSPTRVTPVDPLLR